MSGKNPIPTRDGQIYEGVNVLVPVGGWQLVKSPRAPTSNDKKYPVGAIWVDTATNAAYILTSAPGNWSLFGASSGGAVNSLTGDSGGAILPSSGNITLAGNATQGVSTSGSGSTITFTVAQATSSQFGVIKTASNAQAIAGTDANNAVTSASLLAKLGAVQTAHGVLLAEGNTSAFSVTGAGTTGQALLGSTGADPAFGNLVTVNISNVTGTTQALVAGTSYISNHASATVVFTLPASGALGDRIEIVGNGPGGWQIAQNANQAIHINDQTTTTGTGGSLSSSERYNSVELYCVVSGASTIWNVIKSSGILTVV